MSISSAAMSASVSATILRIGVSYLKRYSDQKETTARTWIFLNLTEGRPRTWSGDVVS
jgi:hypothetical protein